MALIRICERFTVADSFHATVSIDDGMAYPIRICDPFSEAEKQLLEWYFEDYPRFPFVQQIDAQTAAASITTYGEALFTQVFADPEAHVAYKGCIQAGPNALQFEIIGSPQFHALHWEALKDPELTQPLALQTTIVRKHFTSQALPWAVRPSPTINVLIVTARPFGKGDRGCRTISRPLVEELRHANLPVQIEILRPGTYKALDQHLCEISSRHGAGYYHVIHFDVHGGLLSYEELQQVQEQEITRSLNQQRYGRADLTPYVGVKAFLFLEDERGQHADPVEASELAHLLLGHRIPIAFLNACQSCKQVGASETNLGSQLMQAGVQVVLAMSYAVTTSAAEVFMRSLYDQMFASHDLSAAIRQARLALYTCKARRAFFNQTIDLEDWLLPVVYQNQEQRLCVRAFTPEEATAYYSRQAARYASIQPRYGFVGRDLDIVQLEQRLLSKGNLVLVRGMEGAGKTTLLSHLGAWWQSTGLVDKVFSFGYDEQAWTRQQLLDSMARRLLSPVKYLTTFQSLPLDAQQALLCKCLRSQRHLLLLDSLESIAGTHLSVQLRLPPEEQEALRRLLADLVGGRTLVLLSSSSGESWLAHETFGENVYDLPGLDPEAASLLADRVLEQCGATIERQDPQLQQLLNVLDGFPLALEAVLATLAHQTPAEVLSALQAGDVSLKTGDSQKETEDILRCIDSSYRNLSPEAQSLLLCLASFTSVMYLPLLEQYTTHLKQQPALAALPFDRWPEVIREAENWSLLSSDADNPQFLHLQPILPFFLRSRLLAPEQAAVRTAVEAAFREHYDEVGDALYLLLQSKEPQERQMGQVLTRREYENLMTALNLALAAQVSMFHPYSALSAYLSTIEDQRRGLVLGQTVLDHLETHSVGTGTLTEQVATELVSVIDDIAGRQLLLKQYTAAEASYQKTLKLVLQLEHIDEKVHARLKATSYHNLGLVAQEQGQWDKAEQYYQQALQTYSNSNDRYQQAKTRHQLGRTAQEQGQWDKAGHCYQQALQISIEFNDRYEQAATNYRLGLMDQEQGQWVQARTSFLRALEIFVASKDYQSSRIVLRSLALLWQDRDDADLPTAIASIMGTPPAEAEALLREMVGNHPAS